MKNIICILLSFSFFVTTVHANNIGTNEDDEGTRLSLWIPGFLVKAAAGMAQKHTEGVDAALLSKMGSVSLCIREGNQYGSGYDKKIQRKLNRLERRDYDELMSVYDGTTEVHLHMMQNDKGMIRRLVILVDDQEETFVYLKVNCRISADEIAGIVQAAM